MPQLQQSSIVVILLVQLVGLTTLANLASACDFPYYMQTNTSDRDWRTRIKQQYTQFPVTIHVDKNIMRTTSTDPEARSHTRVCLQNLGSDKFLVLHESPGQEGTRYTCVQFLQRSRDVVQIQEAEISARMDSSLCHDANLTLNPWIIMDKNHILDSKPEQCSLQGGFSIRIYDSYRYTGVCDGYQGETRMESECVRGEGLTFYFRQHTCIPENAYMFVTQHTACLANWKHGPTSFMLLKHTQMQYMWVMRLPEAAHDNFVAFVFYDMLADDSSQISRDINYIRLDSVRDVAIPKTSLCVDDYEMCSYFNRACDTDDLALTCPRTCGLCNSTRPSLCNLDSRFMGQWYNAANPGTLALTVNTTFMTTYDGQGYTERFHCVQWDAPKAENDKHTSTKMLVSEYTNGCKPRYSCASFLQKASPILFMKLSESKNWPFTATVTQPADCTNFTFKDDDTLEPNMFKNSNYHLVYSRTTTSVPCELPSGLTNYAATFKDGTVCSSSVLPNQLINGFTVMLSNCPDGILDTSHTCVESSRILTSTLVIVTRSARDPDRIFCWVFPRGTDYDTFYLLEPSQCNESVRRRMRKDRVKALATFTKMRKPKDGNPRPSSITPPDFLPSEVPESTTRQGRPAMTTRISAGGWEGNTTPPPQHPHVPEDGGTAGKNDTGLETGGDGGPVATAIPFVIIGAILFFLVFQIPCSCGASS